MKAILVDAEAQEVREVDVESLADWQRLVGGAKGPVFVEVYYARWLPSHVILVDEQGRIPKREAEAGAEGQHRRGPNAYGFIINGASAQLGGERVIGNGLVLFDARPNFRPPTVSLAELKAMVKWWRE